MPSKTMSTKEERLEARKALLVRGIAAAKAKGIEYPPKKKKGMAKRTGGAPKKYEETGKAKRTGGAPGQKKAKAEKAKADRGPTVSALRKEASVIRRSLTPKPISKMKKEELKSYVANHKNKGKASIAPAGLG